MIQFDQRFSQRAYDIPSTFASEDFGEWAGGGFVFENSVLDPSLAETWIAYCSLISTRLPLSAVSVMGLQGGARSAEK